MNYSLFDYADRIAGENRTSFADLPYLHTLCDALQDCVIGDLPNGAINLACCVAPRHYKTTFVSRAFPAWCLAEVAPDCEFINVSHTADLATENAIAIRQIITSPWHKELYPALTVSKEDRDIKKYFKTTAGGSVYAVGTGGVVTGFGAGKTRPGFGGAIIFDDPMKAQDARSEVKRKSVIDYYTGTLLSRRNSGSRTPIIVVAQRLHLDDLLGWCLKNEPQKWHVVTFPAYQEDTKSVLNPITTSVEELLTMREVDPSSFYAQYQQQPIVPGGTMLRRDWWRMFDLDNNYRYEGLVFATADTAYKAKSTADASVIRVWHGTDKYLDCVDCVYGRWEFPELLTQAHNIYEKWAPRGLANFFIEDKASGTPLEQTMRMQGVPAFAWAPKAYDFPDDKVSRVQESAWTIHGGHVRLPRGYEHSEVLIEEAERFSPDMSHSHDDHVDTLTMAVSIWRSAGGGR